MIDEWILDGRKPADATDRCFTAAGAEIARGLYGSWRAGAAERARLEQIFPTGVCDYTKEDVGKPRRGR